MLTRLGNFIFASDSAVSCVKTVSAEPESLNSPSFMVPMEGLEPPRSHEHQILSLARLPIPPHRRPEKPVVKGGSKLVYGETRVKAGGCAQRILLALAGRSSVGFGRE